MMFILKASRSSTSMAKIRQWLILIARILAVAALITALSRPLVGGWLGWRFSGEPDTVIVLLDRSASMGKKFSSDENLLEHGLKMVVAAGRESALSSHIVLIDSASLKPHEVPSWGVMEDMTDTGITQTAADFPSMFRKAFDYIAGNISGSAEIWVLSDMQGSNWNPSDGEWKELDEKFAALPESVLFRILAAESKNRNNRSAEFSKLLYYHRDNKADIRELFCRIITDSLPANGDVIPLLIKSGKTVQQFKVKLTGARTGIRHILPPAGENKRVYGSLSLPPDTNPEDNICFFASTPPPPERVVVITSDKDCGYLLSAAAVPEYQKAADLSTLISESELPETDLDDISLVICQSEINEQNVQILNKFASEGGIVIFFPPISSGGNKKSIWQKPRPAPSASSDSADFAIFVSKWNRKSGPLADAASGEPLGLREIKINKRAFIRESDISPAASYSDGTPFLYEKKEGNGMIYYCTTLPLKEWSSLGEGPVLVPMLRRLMVEGARRFSDTVYAECGQWYPENNNDIPVRIEIGSVQNKLTENSASEPLYHAGIFTCSGRTIVLNMPASESGTDFLNNAEIKKLFKKNAVNMFREKDGKSGRIQAEVWRYFLFMMFLFLLLEALLCLPAISGKSLRHSTHNDKIPKATKTGGRL